MKNILILICLLFSFQSFSADSKKEVVLKDFDSKLAHQLIEKENGLLLDVRTLIEHTFSSVKGSKRIHVGDLEDQIEKIKKWVDGDMNRPIVVFCAAGIRAAKAKKILIKNGFKRVVNVGGISDY